ncbi:3-hydroxy-3-methylglutaryl-coenzyme A reductase isoform X2 [Planococcus citri]|uniref:3-hydroxy-3-methylglutaryl-coenzyme A reductase isoform X2 n=1 Tax=Planococcus citri TaxID=170843 RepID=UPI0031F7CEB4
MVLVLRISRAHFTFIGKLLLCFSERKMLANIFENHGEFCAKHPWEVIVGVLTITACMLSMDKSAAAANAYNSLRSEETNAVDIIFMTIIRCIAVLYGYYQFCKLRKLGSNYILGIAGLFTVFSSFVFSSTIINFLGSDISDLKDALFFFVLVIDLSKATVLAQFALHASNLQQVNKNIAKGMAIMGPTVTLDTLVGSLVISVGTLSGVKRLEMLCCYACFSFVVNYFVFMTFYPACLSLVLELSKCGSYEKNACFEVKSPLAELLYDEGHKPNPVVQRVKVIMSAGMMIVHAHSRWSLNNMDGNDASKMFPVVPGNTTHTLIRDDADVAAVQGDLMKFLSGSIEHIIILIIVLAFLVKSMIFDSREDLPDQMLERHKLKDTKGIQTEESSKPVVSSMSSQTESSNGVVGEPVRRVRTDSCTQTDISYVEFESCDYENGSSRSLEECRAIYKQKNSADDLTDREIGLLVKANVIPARKLETVVSEPVRGIGVRRLLTGEEGKFLDALKNLPYHNYDYSKVIGACCENIFGYIPVPVGVAGPLLMDDKEYYVPMATTEGCLVASTNRGARALYKSGGVVSCLTGDGMTRGPVVQFPSLRDSYEAELWIKDPDNFEKIKLQFDETSRFARLQSIQIRNVGRLLYMRFSATTGDAMGMNMLSKGTQAALNYIKREHFPHMRIVSLSGNYCADKKATALNWIEGRGKSVVCEAIVTQDVLEKVLKTTASAMTRVNTYKNLIGSAVAASTGGFNAHAANIVTALYIATGQDPAQNVCSSNCITIMEVDEDNKNDLRVTCMMPSIEVGTIGGGTSLPAQSACLEMLGVKGPNSDNPGENAQLLARVVCATVLAGELSLMAALTEGHLVESHMNHNRTSLSERNSASNSRKCSVVSVGKCVSN